MPNKDIFCAVPWHNSHLYWDGTYGACCFERTKPSGPEKNLVDTTIIEWHNSDAMKNFRLRILGNDKLPECEGCYEEESLVHQSKRIKENLKVGIFTKQAFPKSFQQSPWIEKFNYSKETGVTDKLPIDLHIDFGNECNLACKMCHPSASSKIAQQYSKWKILFDRKSNWSNSSLLYENFLKNIQSLPAIHRIHAMGGEVLLNKQFYKFVDWLIENKKTNISLSFVTNGTFFNEEFITKLKLFKSVDIEISIESIHPNNHYIRQGSDTEEVIKNIKKFITHKNNNFNIVLRSVPQLLSVNNYYDLILFCYKNNVSLQSVPLIFPNYLSINLLPATIKKNLIEKYNEVKLTLEKNLPNFKTWSVGRDTTRLEQSLINECNTIIHMLNQPYPDNINELRNELVNWMQKWDAVYKLNAIEYYPEYKEFLLQIGYK